MASAPSHFRVSEELNIYLSHKYIQIVRACCVCVYIQTRCQEYLFQWIIEFYKAKVKPNLYFILILKERVSVDHKMHPVPLIQSGLQIH